MTHDAGAPSSTSTPVPSATESSPEHEQTAPASHRKGGRSTALRSTIEWVVVVAGAIAVALLIRTFLFQAFFIPSGSMETALLTNDRVLVNKLAYRFGDISRGDIIVFERPDTPGSSIEINDLIKRVVGLPGDTLVIDGGAVSINDERLVESYVAAGATTLAGRGTPDPLDPAAPPSLCIPEDPCVVPEGYVFVMGDNRNNSVDSRYPEVGMIDVDTVVGEAFVRIWPPSRLGGL